jgi:large subunit ribosomal protein L27
MSHKKAGGSTRLGRDSASQRMGVKIHDGQVVRKGMIIVRQRGSKFHLGKNVKRAGDDTVLAMANGKVKFTQHKRRRFDGSMKMAKFVNVVV